MKLFSMSSHTSIAVLASAVNVLMEYSLRGVFDVFKNPFFLPGAFLNYFFFFKLLEDLIIRYKLKDNQVFIVSVFFCTIWQFLGPSIVYIPPIIGGINWIGYIFVNIIWWSSLQTILVLYMVTRLVKRDNSTEYLTKTQFRNNFIYFILITLAIRIFAFFPLPNPVQILIMVILTLLTGFWYKRTLQNAKGETLYTKGSLFLNIISILTISYLIFSALYFNSTPVVFGSTHLDRQALWFNVRATFILAFLMWAYRFASGKKIPV